MVKAKCGVKGCPNIPHKSKVSGEPFPYCYAHREGELPQPAFDPLAHRADLDGTPLGVECPTCLAFPNGYCVWMVGQTSWSAFRVEGVPVLGHAERLAAVPGWPAGPVLVEPFCRGQLGHKDGHTRGYDMAYIDPGAHICAAPVVE